MCRALSSDVESVLTGLGVDEHYDDSSIFTTRLDALKSAADVISQADAKAKKGEQVSLVQPQPA